MANMIQPEFKPVFVDNARLIRRREVIFERYLALHKAKEAAKSMLVDDGAISATVYELVKKVKKFKLKWIWHENEVVMISGV